MTQSRQKSYDNFRRMDLEVDVHDWVYLKLSSMKGVIRFDKKRKISPQYVGLYQILRRVGEVPSEHDLPNDLTPVHPVFHASTLKKYVSDPTSIVTL